MRVYISQHMLVHIISNNLKLLFFTFSTMAIINILFLACAMSIWATIASMIILLFLNKHNNKHNKSKKYLPPGDLGLPWIGETIDFYKAQQDNKLFEQFIAPRTKKYGKIFKTRLMGSETVVVNGADANRFFLSNEFKLVISSWPKSTVELMGNESIMEKQGEPHRCIRGIIATSLGSLGLKSIVPKICDTVKSHLNKYWENKNKVSLYRMTKILTFTIMFECLLGMRVGDEVSGLFEKVLDGVFAPPFKFFGSRFSRAKKARHELEKVLVREVREKRREMESRSDGGEREETLLTRLVGALIECVITEKEVVDNIVLLVFAAHDTTSFAIAMTFRMLAHHPNCYSLLLQEHNDLASKRNEEDLTIEDVKDMRYTWQVAKESMRLLPPIFGSFRKANVDIDYEGFVIPKGWKILWTTYGTHYNEEYFPDPFSFNPSRFDKPIQPYAYMPFGGGPRVCAGYQLAKLNILIFTHFVVTKFNWSLQNPNEPITVDPVPFPSLGMPINISPKI